MEQIVILDFGSQYTQVIARRVRELNVYSTLLRYDTPAAEIREIGRNTQGVRLIRLDEGERLAGVEAVGSLGAEDDAPLDSASEGAVDDSAVGDAPTSGG